MKLRAHAVSLGLAVVVAGCAGHADGRNLELRTGGMSRTLGPEALASRSAQSVAVIRTDAGVGLGFVIDPNGFLLTNRHVIEDADHVEQVYFPEIDPPRSFSSAHVVYVDPERDLAVLKVPAVAPLPALKVAKTTGGRAPDRRDPVVVLRREGDDPSGAADRLVAEPGIINRMDVRNELAGPGQFLALTAAVKQGQSGGPVLDRFGKAVGVVTWTWRNTDGGYAIPIDDAQRMLAERPAVHDAPARTNRARQRVHAFLGALSDGRYQTARRMTSPSWAKQVRESTMSEILAQAMETGDVIHSFVGALDRVSTDDGIETDERRMELLDDMVSKTGSSQFCRALGVSDRVDPELVVSFFYEFGHAYLIARRFGGKSSAEAVDAGLTQLATMEAARTFALAELSTSLAGRELRVEAVEVHPSEYRPTATVKLIGPVVADSAERWLLVLRFEWGDWYVADVRASVT